MERAQRSTRAGSADSAASTEDGEVSPYDPYSRPSRSPPPKKKTQEEKDEKADLDAQNATYDDINGARLSRYEIVDMMYKDGFEDVIKGKSAGVPWRAVSSSCLMGRRVYPYYRWHGSWWTTEVPYLEDRR